MRQAVGGSQSKSESRPVDVSTAEVVCLVDDDPSILRSVSRLLESAGYKVNAFGDAQPFLGYLSQNCVSVVVLDIWMERMTGLDLLAHLSTKSPDTRVIFITGHEDPAIRATVMDAGAFGFLRKPFDAEEFLGLVHNAFRG